MKAQKLRSNLGEVIDGPVIITPRVFEDERGFFFESWNERSFQKSLIDCGSVLESESSIAFRQDNHSRSTKGVLRGLHYQLHPEPQGKLVRCISGSIFDVAVDVRQGSPTFKQWVAVELTASNYQQLWVPVGFAHGFLTMSDHAEVVYKTSGFWNRDCERGLRWDDPQLAIAWPLKRISFTQPLLADKDATASLLNAAVVAGDLFP